MFFFQGILLDEIERTHRSETVVVPKAISAAESTGRSIDASGSGSSIAQKLSVSILTCFSLRCKK